MLPIGESPDAREKRRKKYLQQIADAKNRVMQQQAAKVQAQYGPTAEERMARRRKTMGY